MSYRNKTYIAFDADNDIKYYRLMQAWKENDRIDFDFHNAHELNNLTTKAPDNEIYRKLRERMNNTKQLIVLVGESTKNLFKFVRWEIKIAQDKGLPIIAVNLDKTNGETVRTPAILKDRAYFVSIPFEMKKVKYALDNFPSEYARRDTTKNPSARSYDWDKVSL